MSNTRIKQLSLNIEPEVTNPNKGLINGEEIERNSMSGGSDI